MIQRDSEGGRSVTEGGTILLHSQRLQFSSDGKLLACSDANALTLVSVEPTGAPVRIQQPGVRAIAVFAEQVWTLDEHRAELRRYLRDGRALGEPRKLATAPCTEWIVVPTGAPAVLTKGVGRRAVVEHFGDLIEIAVTAHGLVIPLDGRRHVICQEQLVRFGGGISPRLAKGVVPLGGAAVFDAKRLLLVVADARGERGAILFATETGRVQRELELPSGETRFAARRGVLVVHAPEGRFAILDIRSGGAATYATAPVEVDDFAVDPAAKRIAIRSGETVRVYPLGLLMPDARAEIEIALDTQRLPLQTDGVARSTTEVAAPSGPTSLPLRIALDPPGARVMRPGASSCEPIPEYATQPLPIAVGAPAEVSIVAGAAHESTSSSSILAPQSISALQLSSLRDGTSAPRASGSSEPPSQGDAPTRAEGSMPASMPPQSARPVSLDVRPEQGSGTLMTSASLEPRVVDLFKLRGFGEPPRTLNVSRSEAARLLEAELDWIGLRALLAIAHAWDTGRIAFANESRYLHELEATAILGMNRDKARDRVEQVQARLTEHERALANDPSRRAESTPLGALAAEFQLSPLATNILLAVAAPALWGEAARLYGILANDPTRALVDELLVEQILCEDRASRVDIAHELAPAAPLCEYGLIRVGTERPRPHASLTVDRVVLARLRAEPAEFGRGSALTVRSADRDLSRLVIPAQLGLDAMRYLSRKPSRDHQARIALRGPLGSGRRTLLAALAARAGRSVGLIDLARLPRAPEAFGDALRTEMRRALLSSLIPCLSGVDEVSSGSDDPLRRVVQDVLRAHPGPAAVHLVPRAKIPLDPGYLLLDLPTPTESQRLDIWREALSEHELIVEDPESLAARYRVGPGTIRTAVAFVAQARAEQGRLAGDVLADIHARMRQTREDRFGDQARRVERLASWSSLVLPDDIMLSLRELVARVRHRRTVYDQWNFDSVISTARGLTALFEGPPGTGKTLVAGAIARELGLDLYQVDLSKIMSKWIGETEKNLGAMFDAAEDGQVMLLLDEADSLFAKRSEVKSSNDRFANLEVNYLLQRLDAFEGFAILTTNFGTSIDPAFKRRLSFRLTFPFPDADMRAELWRVHLPAELPLHGWIDLDALARKYELSGGYIRNACLRAAFLAAEDGTPLTQQHLERAVELEFAEVGKLSRSGRME